MQLPPRPNRIFLALCANAALLLLILLVLITKDNRFNFSSPAFAQQQPLAGGSNGVFIVPGQLSPNVWGCYLLNPDRQTLNVYQYLPNDGLKLVAARDFQYDAQLKNFNTLPAPSEIRDLAQQPQNSPRVTQGNNPKSPEAPKE